MIRKTFETKIFDVITQNGLKPDDFEGNPLSDDVTKPWRLTLSLIKRPYFDVSCPTSFDLFKVSYSKYSPTHIVVDIPKHGYKELAENQLIAELKKWLLLEAKPAIEDAEKIINEYTSIVRSKSAIKKFIGFYNQEYNPEILFSELRGKIRIEGQAAINILKLAHRDKLIHHLPKDLVDHPEDTLLYNLYIKTRDDEYNLICITEDKLSIAIDAYLNGDDSFTLSGSKRYVNNIITFKVYTSNLEKRRFVNVVNNLKEYSKTRGGQVVKPKILSKYGDDLTDVYIGDRAYGHNNIVTKSNKIISDESHGSFVDTVRVDELTEINSENFDLKRLLQLIEELNSNYRLNNYLSVIMLCRTILNHVPPIFGHEKFEQVAANQAISKKKIFQNLQTNLKNIADINLHQQIRSKETLPNRTQIDFKQQMDVLLEEIIHILG